VPFFKVTEEGKKKNEKKTIPLLTERVEAVRENIKNMMRRLPSTRSFRTMDNLIAEYNPQNKMNNPTMPSCRKV